MKNKKKLLIMLVILIVIFLGLIVIRAIIDAENERKEDEVALTLKENLDTEFLSNVKVSDFIENLNGEIIDDYKIETNALGEKEVVFNYKSQRNKDKTKSFKINVVDTTKPRIYMSSSMTVTEGYNKNITETVLSGDECDPNPERTIEGEYDFNTPGSYKLEFVVKDSSGNEERHPFTLKVIEKSDKKTTTTTTKKDPILFSDCLENYKTENTSLGIDVSKWQGDVDWEAVKNAGAEFVFLRVAHQDEFDGDYGEDVNFNQYIKGATEAGLKVRSIYIHLCKNKRRSRRPSRLDT